jgi:hypothetical protein
VGAVARADTTEFGGKQRGGHLQSVAKVASATTTNISCRYIFLIL